MLRSMALFALSLSSAGSLAVAAPPTRTVVTDDGEKLEYTMQLEDGERIRFDGRILPSREPFTLILQPNGRVVGNMGRPVSFSIGQKRRDRLAAYLKARQPLTTVTAELAPVSPSGN